MQVADAQREVRRAFLGGSTGLIVSSLPWGGSAAIATWGTARSAMIFLIVGGFFIFPLSQLGLKLIGRAGTLRRENPLRFLAMQIAFTILLAISVILGASMYRLNWFYPAFMIIVGAHYLPFIFLYGMRLFGFLAALLIAAGLLIGLNFSDGFATGGWVTAGILLVFAPIFRKRVVREERGQPSHFSAR
jgi:hypothetical protein